MKAKEHKEDIATMMGMVGRVYLHMASEMLKLGEELGELSHESPTVR